MARWPAAGPLVRVMPNATVCCAFSDNGNTAQEVSELANGFAQEPQAQERIAPTSGPNQDPVRPRRPPPLWPYLALILAVFALGVLIMYMVSLRSRQGPVNTGLAKMSRAEIAALMDQVNPPEGYELPALYGDLGPRLIESGVIDFDAVAAVFENAGDPLTQSQVEILRRASHEQIVISRENAHFLLNFFWAVGLVNKNPILTEGPIVQNSGGQIERFASTGGWTLGTKPVTELYASADLIPLTPEQQGRVEEVASAVYRPCCNNATLFPDCNHGMAMLGLLELLASQDASVDEMFAAAKYVNAYWFPQQTLETAIYLEAAQNADFAQADSRTVTGKEFFSASGASRVNASLRTAGLLPGPSGDGGSCGN